MWSYTHSCNSSRLPNHHSPFAVHQSAFLFEVRVRCKIEFILVDIINVPGTADLSTEAAILSSTSTGLRHTACGVRARSCLKTSRLKGFGDWGSLWDGVRKGQDTRKEGEEDVFELHDVW